LLHAFLALFLLFPELALPGDVTTVTFGGKMGKIKFGTDGWRAIISEDFTFDNVRVVAQAIADFVKSEKGKIYDNPTLVVGYDTRFLSEKYAELVSLVLVANGIKVILGNCATPTPSVSFSIWERKLTGGVMITASHNPGNYNGIKYKNAAGGSASNAIIKKIESFLYKNEVKTVSKDEAISKKKLVEEDILTPHLNFIKKYVDLSVFKKLKLNVLVDSMNATGKDYIEGFLKKTNVKVTTINKERDTLFGNRSPEPNELTLKDFNQMVKKGDYDIGFATDGDADRLGVAASDGTFLTGHKIMALLLLHLLEDRKLTGGVVQTICGTMLINKICKKYGLPIYETPVGFKYICEKMEQEDVLIGGEETGGIAYKNSIPERDGVLTALLVLEMLAVRKKSLKALLKGMDDEYGTFEYKRRDLRIPIEKRNRIMEDLKKKPFDEVLGKKIIDVKDYDGIKFIAEDNTWLMLRPSGTEPKLRIYSEGKNAEEALKIIEFGRKYVEKQ
jgi:alpha-D-glucose phosphate-specific phosphoglucomutase